MTTHPLPLNQGRRFEPYNARRRRRESSAPDRTYRWDQAALDGLELAADTATENRAEVTAKARAAATKRRPALRLSGKVLVRAKELWVDSKRTAAQVG